MSSSYLPVLLSLMLASSVLTTLVLMYLQSLKVHLRSARCWMLAYACISLRNLSALLAVINLPWLGASVDFFLIAYACFLWCGIRIFSGRTVYVMPVMLTFAVSVIWGLMAYATELPFVWRVLPAYFFGGFLLIGAAATIWKTQRNTGYLGYLLLAGLLLLKGMHVLNYPFLRNITWFAPIGFGITIVLDLAIGMMLLIAALLRQQKEAEQTSELLRQEIQERKLAEQLSRQRENLFEKVFQLVPDVLLICREKDGCFLEVNRHWEKVTGYSRAESIGHYSTDLHLWCEETQRREMLATLRANGEVHNFQAAFLHKRGHQFYVEISGTRFEVGSDSYVMYVTRDISALRQSEKIQQQVKTALNEREKLLSIVFQLTPDTLTITKLATGEYIDVNRNWEPLTGYTREEAVGHTSTELNLWAHPEQRADLIAHIKNTGEIRDVPVAFHRKNGEIIQCRISGSKFDSDDESYLLLTSRNIEHELATERARMFAERLLRESEQKYSALFQLSPIPLVLLDVRDQSIVEVNDLWLKQFSYVREDVVGKNFLHINFWEDGDQPGQMLQSLLADVVLDQVEVLVKDSLGKRVICMMSARLLTMNQNRMCIFSVMDVTRQYQAEQEIREMTAQLEVRVKQRTLKLEQANAELAEAMDSLKHAQDELVRSEKMAALGSLVAGVAHELNTPIGNSVTVASTLQDKTRELLRDISEGKLRRSVLDQYLQSASNGTALLMRTLGIARELIGSFKQVAVDQSSNQRRQFDLKHVLEEVIVTLAPMYKKGPYQLTTDFSEGISMDSYPGPLGQIITNFMTNALTHAFDGRDAGEMHLISCLIDPDAVRIVFSDNGLGIDENEQKRVFDPFFTTKLGQGGSGLGMNIVYNLVTGVLGGDIHLDSKPDEGTRFTLNIPRIAPEIKTELKSEIPFEARTAASDPDNNR
ncbi:PAS domain-containing sensor histidine kinase [Undibacterium sp. SXout7W]|uniref:PAS domain-containing sensor histidine kinase n=1 Tax=Undibacterium sp. SXout7W TaxID=3413049 RepID=UPI003BEFD12B